MTCWKCGKPGHFRKDCKGVKIGNKSNGSGTSGSGNGNTNSLKGQNIFSKSFEIYYVTYIYLMCTLCRMMMLRGGLTLEQQFMCVKIEAGSRLMSQ